MSAYRAGLRGCGIAGGRSVGRLHGGGAQRPAQPAQVGGVEQRGGGVRRRTWLEFSEYDGMTRLVSRAIMNSVAASAVTKSMPTSRPDAAHLADEVRALALDRITSHGEDLGAEPGGAFDEALGAQHPDRRGHGDRGQRAAGERRGVQQRVRVERREDLVASDHAADRHHASAEDLSGEQHVGCDAREVGPPPVTEPAQPGLDLVEDQSAPVAVQVARTPWR